MSSKSLGPQKSCVCTNTLTALRPTKPLPFKHGSLILDLHDVDGVGQKGEGRLESFSSI